MMIVLQMLFPPVKMPVENENAAPEIAAAQEENQDPAQQPDETESSNQVAVEVVERKGIDPGIKIRSDAEILELVKSEGAAENAAINAYRNQRSFTSVRQMGDLLTVGSLDADGANRYLITVNPYGGTVRRIELNVRDERTGRYKYRDLVWKGGYIGSLEVHDTASGVRVGVVGAGTPANLANSSDVQGGILPGDILKLLNGESINSADDFGHMLAQTKPDEVVEVTVQRGDSTLRFETLLTEKPIELIRPEPGVLDPTFVYDESFLLTLHVPSDNPQNQWVEIDADIRESQWEVIKADDQSVELQFEIASEKLKEHGLAGPIKVVKRFSVPQLNEELVHSFASKTWHWDFDFEVVNESDKTQKIGYELKGPTGTPSETWWYSQKTHGRSSALFQVAGARDVLGSTEYRPFQFWGGPEIVKESLEGEDAQTKFFVDPFKAIETPEEANVRWLGVDALYFNVTMFPDIEEGEKFNVFSAFSEINGGKVPKNTREHKLVDCTFRVFKTLEVAASGSTGQPFDIFSAPKEKEILDVYKLDETRAFGWFWWCSKPLLWLLHLLYFLTFQISYTIPIIILTIMVRCIMIPFSRRAALNAQMMQHLQPQMKEIADKYKDNMEQRAKAQQELFKKYNYKPLGGCFMGFIQLPVFLGLYRGLSLDIALRDQSLIPGLAWCSNLSGPDQLMYWKDWWPYWLGESGWFGPFLNILPLATMGLFLLQQKMFTPPAMDEQQKMMQKMMSFMMLFMAIMFFKVPAGLCVYFVTSSIWAILEKKLLPKPELDTAKIEAKASNKTSFAEKGMAMLNRSKPDAGEKLRQDAEMRKQRNRDRKKLLKDRKKDQ